MKNSDKSAFAKSAFYHPDGGLDYPQDGLTKREYFAAMALQGILAGRHPDSYINKGRELWIKFSVDCADLLLKELEKSLSKNCLGNLTLMQRIILRKVLMK